MTSDQTSPTLICLYFNVLYPVTQILIQVHVYLGLHVSRATASWDHTGYLAASALPWPESFKGTRRAAGTLMVLAVPVGVMDALRVISTAGESHQFPGLSFYHNF
jgi:hypothetical protein